MHTARHALGHTRNDDTTEKTASVQSERRPERAGASMPPRTRAFAVGPGPAAASMSPVLYSRATVLPNPNLYHVGTYPQPDTRVTIIYGVSTAYPALPVTRLLARVKFVLPAAVPSLTARS